MEDTRLAILNQEVVELYQAVNYDRAALVAQKVFQITEQYFGPDHPDVATSLNNLAYLYDTQGAYAKAEPLYKRSLAIREKALGPDHPDVALSLKKLGYLYRTLGDYAQAVPLLERALAILEMARGPDLLDVAGSLENLAVLYRTTKRVAEAKALEQREAMIRHTQKNDNAMGLFDFLKHETSDNITDDRYIEILAYFDRHPFGTEMPVLSMLSDLPPRDRCVILEALREKYPSNVEVYNKLSLAYLKDGQYEKAHFILNEGRRSGVLSMNIYMELKEKIESINAHIMGVKRPSDQTIILGVSSSKAYAETLSKIQLYTPTERSFGEFCRILIRLCQMKGDRKEEKSAALFAQKALQITEQNADPDRPEVATNLNNLADFYYGQSDYAKAEPLFKRSLVIRLKALGPGHPDVATSLDKLAVLYLSLGYHSKAELLFKRSLAIMEKALGPDHPDVASSLDNLAIQYRIQGDDAKAVPLLERALVIREKALGPDHPDVAESLNYLAGLYYDQGAYVKAELLHKRLLVIREKALGPDHPDVACSFDHLAVLYRATKRGSEAEVLEHRAAKIRALKR
jgi:tetratricopeptide (TPR) repeat protein